jgi:tRNA-uridine 2-sulfurtransferase
VQYSVKLADLWTSRGERRYELDDIMLLKVGRHLRPRPHFKLIIGREEGENNFLEGYRKQYVHLRAVDHEGPLALIDGSANDDDLELAARLVCRFGRGRDAERVQVQITDLQGATRIVEVVPLGADDVPKAWYL